MGLDVAETPRANGLKTALDTIVAPQEAFERLRSAPTWGWAFLIAAVLLVAGNLLQRPAQLHAAAGTMQHLFATNSFFANFTGAQKQQALERATHPTTVQTAIGLIGVVVSLLVAALLNSIVLWAGSAIGRGTANFRNLWAASL
ncbi:MAG TPA: hypothetical protein VNG31_00825, partial [Candidatus Baltobacteraceae bacterium]|nr:hypothetical protein [Candidatus Baltobacteraceae bacterium]